MADHRLCVHISPRWDPTHSLLGEWVRRRAADRWQAQAYFILLSISLFVALVIANFVAWGIVGASITAAPGGTVAVTFWWSQIAAFGAWMVLALFGWAPGVQVEVSEDGLTVTQGKHTLAMPRWTIERSEVISAMRYHRHYRRYAETTAFVGVLPAHLLLVESEAYCCVLGLEGDDLRAVQEALASGEGQPAAAKLELVTEA